MLQNLSMILCTYERAHMLPHIINYHAPLGATIFVLDASQAPLDIHGLQKKFPNVHYYHLPGTTIIERYVFIANKIQSPYCVFRADRRHHANHFLGYALNLLEARPDYASVAGIWLSYTHTFLPRYFMGLFDKCLEIEDVNSRIKSCASSSSAYYYNVIRTDITKKLIQVLSNLEKITVNPYYHEVVFQFLIFFSGKMKKLTCLAGVVHEAKRMDLSYMNTLTDSFEMYYDKKIMEQVLPHILQYFSDETHTKEALTAYFYEFSRIIYEKIQLTESLQFSNMNSDNTIKTIQNMYKNLNEKQENKEQEEIFLRTYTTSYLYKNFTYEHLQAYFSKVDQLEQIRLLKLIQAIVRCQK